MLPEIAPRRIPTTFRTAPALMRLGDTDPNAPRGCVFLVEQMEKAEQMYVELNALLPDKVAVWTSDHDVNCKQPRKVLNPSRRFSVDDLEDYDVAIVTHAFYKNTRSHKARNILHDGSRMPRALTVIDEQFDNIDVFDVTLEGVTKVLAAV